MIDEENIVKRLSKKIALPFAVSVMLCCGMSGAVAETPREKDASTVSEQTTVMESVPKSVTQSEEPAPVSIPMVKSTEETAKLLKEEPAPEMEVVIEPEPVKDNNSKTDGQSDSGESSVSQNNQNENSEKSSLTVRDSDGASRSGERTTSKGVAQNNGFISPVKNPVQSSGFGSRVHPITGKVKNHNGVDYAATCGTKIYAPADGTVTMAGWKNGTAGNVITIQHDDFVDKNGNILETVISTNYYHLLKFLVNDGDFVEQGEVIAEVGSTGRSTGCHLHWELMVDGVKVDPTPYLSDEEVDPEIYTEEKSNVVKPNTAKTEGEEQSVDENNSDNE